MKAAINSRLLQTISPREKPFDVRDTKLTGFILRVNPTGRITYVCEYGRGKRINIGRADILTPSEARDQAMGILADAQKGKDPMEVRRKVKGHTLSSFIDEIYSPWANTHQKSANTTISRLRANFLPIFGNKQLSDITPLQIEKWRSERLESGAKAASVNRYLATLKAALSRAVEWELITENPLRTVKQLRLDGSARVRFLDEEEESRLLAALNERESELRQGRQSANQWRSDRGYAPLPELENFADHIKPMILISLNTGLRRGELFNLTWDDLDLPRSTLTVRGGGAKSGQTRHLPLNSEALDILNLWRAQQTGNGLVFQSKHGNRFDNVNSAFRRLLSNAQIVSFRWHDLRHSFASHLVMAGVDLNTVRELLGHADIKMTLRYAHLAPAVKATAVQKLVRAEP